MVLNLLVNGLERSALRMEGAYSLGRSISRSLTFPANFLPTEALRQLNLSAGRYRQVLKLARPMADLTACGQVQAAQTVVTLPYTPRVVG